MRVERQPWQKEIVTWFAQILYEAECPCRKAQRRRPLRRCARPYVRRSMTSVECSIRSKEASRSKVYGTSVCYATYIVMKNSKH